MFGFQRLVPFALLIGMMLWGACAAAQPSSWRPLSSTPRDVAEVVTPQVKTRLIAHAPQGLQVGQPVWLGLYIDHAPQWHTYWQNPGDSGLPTTLTWRLPTGWQAADVQWPLPRKLKAATLTNYGYDGETLLVVPITIGPQWTDPQDTQVTLQANWLVCRLECIPQEGSYTIRLPARTSIVDQGPAFDRVLAQQPTDLERPAQAQFEGPHLQLRVDGLPSAWQGQRMAVFPEQPELLDSAAEQHPLALQSWQDGQLRIRLPQNSLRTQAPDQLHLWLIQGDDPHRQAIRVRADIHTAWPPPPQTGSMPPLESPTGWGFVLALLGAFAGGLILNLMPCVLPVLALKVMAFARHSQAHRAHRIAGLAYTGGVLVSFLVLGTTVLSLRAAGEQLGWGFQLQSPWVVAGLAVLFGLIALNLFGWLEVGQWLPSSLLSLQARHPVVDAGLSGVLAVAVASPCTAPFMGASLGLALSLPAWQAMSIFATMGLGLALPYLMASWWPWFALHLPQPGPWMVTLRRILGLPMLATVVWLLWVLSQQLGWSSSAQSQDEWGAWSETAVAHSLANDRPVFVDFTAAWCVTCQVNKRTTLQDAHVLQDFAAKQVTLLRADWTRRDPAITAALTQLGRSGVPVYVLYAPDRPPRVLSELLTPAQIRDALAPLGSTPGGTARQ